MWACIDWMPLANLYFTMNFLHFLHCATNKEIQTENDTYISLVAVYFVIFSGIAAVIQSGKALPGLPNTSVPLDRCSWENRTSH